MSEKIQIVLFERSADLKLKSDYRSPFFDDLEAKARSRGAEARRGNNELRVRSGPPFPDPRITGYTIGEFATSDMLTIVAGAAATAVFVRNVIGSVKDWIDLENTEKSVEVTIGDKVVKIKQGDDVLAIVRQHFPDEGTSNPL